MLLPIPTPSEAEVRLMFSSLQTRYSIGMRAFIVETAQMNSPLETAHHLCRHRLEWQCYPIDFMIPLRFNCISLVIL